MGAQPKTIVSLSLLAFIILLSQAFIWRNVVYHGQLLKRHPHLEAQKIKTPKEARDYIIRNIIYKSCLEIYGKGNFWASPALTFQNQAADSAGAAILAASLLEDDGYPPYILRMLGPVDGTSSISPEPRWTLFLYRVDGRYGSVGSRRMDYRGAVFEGIVELVREAGYAGYELHDVSRLYNGRQRPNWKTTETNLAYNVYRLSQAALAEVNLVPNNLESTIAKRELPGK